MARPRSDHSPEARATTDRLEKLGFSVLTDRLVPPNDGGISYGQAAIAVARTAV